MRIGPYEIGEEVGRGGMGVVYRARSDDGREVAIKVLTRTDSRKALLRFDRERRLLKKLGPDDGFVPLLDAGLDDTGAYIVMPFLEGGTLRDRIDAGGGRLPPAEVARIGAALARSLAVAHARGVIHRDLKPDNVLFDGDGRALIADLGLAKHFLPDQSSVGLSRTGEFKGTLGYVAPEQVRDAKAVAPAADVYGLGVILFEALTGKIPFTVSTPVEMIVAIINHEMPKVRELRPTVPADLARAVDRCLGREPRTRPTPEELAGTLAALAAQGGSSDGRRLGVGASLAAAALAVAFVAAAGGVAATLGHRERVGAPTGSGSGSGSATGERDPESATDAPQPVALIPPFDRLEPPDWLPLRSVFGRQEWAVGEGGVIRIDVSGDGSTAAASSTGSVVLVHDVESGRLLAELGPHGGPVRAIDLDHDGGRVLTGDDTGTVRVWDVASGAAVFEVDGHEREIRAVAFSSDGTRAITGDVRGAIRLWNLAEASLEAELVPPRARRVTDILVLPDGRVVVCVHGELLLLDLASFGAPLRIRPSEARGGGRLGLSADGASLVVTQSKLGLALVDPVAFRPIGLLGTRRGDGGGDDAGITDVAPLRGSLMACSTSDGTIHVIDLAARRSVAGWASHAKGTRALAATPDGRRVFSGGVGGVIREWNAQLGEERDPPVGHRGTVTTLAVTPDGERLVSGGRDGWLHVWDLATGDERRLATKDRRTWLTALAVDGSSQVIAGHLDGATRLWDLETLECTIADVPHSGAVTDAIALPPDAGALVTVGPTAGGPTVMAYQTRARARAPIGPVEPTALVAAASPLERDRFLVGMQDGTIRWMDVAGGRVSDPIAAPTEELGVPSALAISPDSRHALSGHRGGRLMEWSLIRPEVRALARYGSRTVRAIAFAPDGRAAVAAGGRFVIWEGLGAASPPTEVPISLQPLRDRATAAVFSIDGRELFIGTQRGAILRFAVQPR